MSRTVQDVIEEAIKEVNENDISKNDKEVINKLEALVIELKGEGVTGKDFKTYSADELSRIAGNMAILKVSLGDIMVKAERNFKVNENIVKLRKANLRESAYLDAGFNGNKPTQSDVSAYIDKRTFTDTIKGTFKEEHFKRVNRLWWSCTGLLSVISKRIDILQGERSEAKHLGNSLDYVLPVNEEVIDSI